MKLLFFILLSIFATSCVNNKNNRNVNIAKKEKTSGVSTKMPEIDLQEKYPQKKILLDEIADIEYIPLETSDSVLLGQNIRKAVSKDLIVIADITQGTVFFFNEEGKYINSFNHKGPGNKEYTNMTAFCVDFNQKEVFIWDYQLLYRIMVYSFEGEFKRELKLNAQKWVKRFFVYDKTHLAGYDTNDKSYKNPSDKSFNKYPYFLINKQDGSITTLPLKVDNRITNMKTWNVGTEFYGAGIDIENWMKADDGIYISDFALDTIYHCVGNKMLPKAIRKNNPDKDKVMASLCLESNYYSFFKAISWNVDETTKQMNITDDRILVYDKHNAAIYDAFVTLKDFSEKLRIYIGTGCRDNIPEGYYIDHYSVDMLNFYLEKNALKGKIKEIAESLEEDANPVLIIAKFKE